MKTKWLIYGAALVCGAVAGMPAWFELAKGGSEKPARQPTLEELEADGGLERDFSPRSTSPASRAGMAPPEGTSAQAKSSRATRPAVAAAAPNAATERPGSTVVLGLADPSEIASSRGAQPKAADSELVNSLRDTLQALDGLGRRSGADPERFSALWKDDEPTLSAAVEAPAVRGWAEVSADFPVRGILLGADQSLALLGDRVVRVGDELMIDDELTLTAIDARCLHFEFRGQPVRLELPPFRPRSSPSLSTSSQAGDSSPVGLELEPIGQVEASGALTATNADNSAN